MSTYEQIAGIGKTTRKMVKNVSLLKDFIIGLAILGALFFFVGGIVINKVMSFIFEPIFWAVAFIIGAIFNIEKDRTLMLALTFIGALAIFYYKFYTPMQQNWFCQIPIIGWNSCGLLSITEFLFYYVSMYLVIWVVSAIKIGLLE